MNAKEWDQPVSPMGGAARYWRLYMLNNWGALWGMGFTRLEFKGSPTDAQSNACAAIKTKDACIYAGTKHAPRFSAVATASSCGWCSQTQVFVFSSTTEQAEPLTKPAIPILLEPNLLPLGI